MEVNTAVTKLMRLRASVIHVCIACMFVLERVHVYSFAFRPFGFGLDRFLTWLAPSTTSAERGEKNRRPKGALC